MATQIIRTGSSVAVEIPEELLRQANLAVGDPVEWKLNESGHLVFTPLDDSLWEAGTVPAVDEADYEEWKLREIEAGFADLDAGNGVDGERVKEWLMSWGTDHELPMPQ
jgi:antitoxin component of MazEF toxin-antitoxin module